MWITASQPHPHPTSLLLILSHDHHDESLKEYSVILTAPFYGINQKILTKKRLFPKFQLILIFSLTSYA